MTKITVRDRGRVSGSELSAALQQSEDRADALCRNLLAGRDTLRSASIGTHPDHGKDCGRRRECLPGSIPGNVMILSPELP